MFLKGRRRKWIERGRSAVRRQGDGAIAQLDLSVIDSVPVIGTSAVGHTQAIPIVKHRTQLEKQPGSDWTQIHMQSESRYLSSYWPQGWLSFCLFVFGGFLAVEGAVNPQCILLYCMLNFCSHPYMTWHFSDVLQGQWCASGPMMLKHTWGKPFRQSTLFIRFGGFRQGNLHFLILFFLPVC